MFFSNTVLSMDMEFLGNKDMTSNELRDVIYRYNNIVNNDIVNKNSFYKNYSKIDPNFKKLYQKEGKWLSLWLLSSLQWCLLLAFLRRLRHIG